MPTKRTATSAVIGACQRQPRLVDVEATRGLVNTTFDGVIDITSALRRPLPGRVGPFASAVTAVPEAHHINAALANAPHQCS
ncbi:hypothetical protein DVH05_001753 [Phytophthora capsici]|nr:hypothetical protein DVH05_001753 [Phytophthora capsici]